MVKETNCQEFTKWVIVEIFVPDNRLRKALENDSERKRRFGPMAPKVRALMGSLRGADSLGTFWPPMKKPERCHELTADLKGFFSFDLKYPFRLLVRAVEEGTPSLDQHDRWNRITKIEIDRIEDTHG